MANIAFMDLNSHSGFSRVPRRFKDLGAQVYGIGVEGGLLLRSLALEGRLKFPLAPTQQSFSMMATSIHNVAKKWNPDFLLVGDDSTIRNLLEIQLRLNKTGKRANEQEKTVRNFLDKNLCDFSCYTRTGQMDYITKSGFPVPDFRQIDRLEDIGKAYAELGGTTYFKLSFESGGLGLVKLQQQSDIATELKKVQVAHINPSHHFPAILQAETKGKEYVVSFAAWQGKLLGYLVIDVIEKAYETGPSSVVQSVYRPHWQQPIEKLVKSMNYSGFGGLDVIEQDADKLPDVLEMNTRPTHTLPLSEHLGVDLISRFYGALEGNKPTAKAKDITAVSDKVCAVFPQELYRDANSKYIKHGVFDVPWDDPPLFLGLLDQAGNLAPHFLKGYADILREKQGKGGKKP